ncbi:MAG: cobalamin-binding protein [Cytophagales bacterium]|nr:cobalamin-binding protein [Armatimonadota bacterium]
MRIVSLLPSATEIVAALGLGDQLVAVTHECDYPPDLVAGKPVVTASIIPKTTSSPSLEGEEGDEPLPPNAGEIDRFVREALASGESLYRIDLDLLRDLKPDLLITQGLCDVCAVNHKAVVQAVEALGPGVQVIDLQPTTLAEVLESFRQVGAATDRAEAAEALAVLVRGRWEAVRQSAARATEHPRTLLLEWPDPPFTAGHWNPELLALANGEPAPWDTVGVASRTLHWDEIRAFAPEMIVLLACGMDAYRALDEAYALLDVPGWFDLPAVRNGECYAVDGNAFFNRPGPRLAESAEILATILHPERFTDMLPPYSVQRFDSEMLEAQESEGEEAAK